MKHFLTCCIGLWTFFFVIHSTAACTIKIDYSDSDTAILPDHPGDGSKMPAERGIAREVVTLAAERIGCNITWRAVPNRRVLIDVMKGTADAMLLFSFNDERAGFAVYPMKDGKPDPAFRLATLSYRIYVKNGSALRWDGKQFMNLNGPIGINVGYSVGKEIAMLGATVDEAPGSLNNILKLQKDRIAAFIMLDMIADAAIEKAQAVDVIKLAQPFSTKDYYLPVSKAFYASSPELVHQLWHEIAEIRNKKGAELAKKYNHSP